MVLGLRQMSLREIKRLSSHIVNGRQDLVLQVGFSNQSHGLIPPHAASICCAHQSLSLKLLN